MASPTRGMHGLARLPSDLWLLNLSGALTDEETMRLSVLDENCFQTICLSTLVIGPAVPRLRRVLLCSRGPQKIILVVAKGENSLATDVLQFFVDAMMQHSDKIKTIKSVRSFDKGGEYWDAGRTGLRGAPRTFPALTDTEVGFVPVVKAFRQFDWKTPSLTTLKARARSECQPLLDLTDFHRLGGFQQSLSHLLAHSPLIRHVDVFPLSTLVCGTALDTHAASLEAVGDMVFITHDQEMEGLVTDLPRVQPLATRKRIGIFDRNLAFDSTLPASFDSSGRTSLRLLVELGKRGYCALLKRRDVQLKGAPERADKCPPEVEGSIRDIVKRGICQADTVVMSYDERSQPWDNSWDLTDSSGRPVVFDKTKFLIIKCVDSNRGYVGHDAIAGWTAGGWTSVQVLTLDRVEYMSVKDHVCWHRHRFTEEGIYDKDPPEDGPAAAAAGQEEEFLNSDDADEWDETDEVDDEDDEDEDKDEDDPPHNGADTHEDEEEDEDEVGEQRSDESGEGEDEDMDGDEMDGEDGGEGEGSEDQGEEHGVLSAPLQLLLRTMPPTLHAVRLINVPWWAVFDALVCLSEGTAAQPGEGGNKLVCLEKLEIETEVQESPLVVPEKGGALWSTMQERLSVGQLTMHVKTEFDYPLNEEVPPYSADLFSVYYELILLLQPDTVVLTVNTSRHAKQVVFWSDDGDDMKPDEAKYPFLKGLTGDIRARYRMCHCGARGDHPGHMNWTDNRMDVVLKRRRLGDLSGLAADKCAMQ
ncbi:unnamed protein product [Vitrella brassicaformis CCMP3155]|uniref:Uncharacterized protein n=2 Tax=Vitrella brassicaformis TaxID=1169539 RepID=A0A0G4FW91_VITBC|nr:unnamed protein product [Vitrella brassicaformis CCMP3155]|eukprot:CEM19250.1 unnamed protein product [Vitrella brassicaformis CCMP3155]